MRRQELTYYKTYDDSRIRKEVLQEYDLDETPSAPWSVRVKSRREEKMCRR